MDKSYFSLPYQLPDIDCDDDTQVRFPSAFAEKMIEAYTTPGEKVFDPFAGFGTTLIAAQQLGRIGYGIEYEAKRHAYIQKQLRPPSTIIHGSALEIEKYDLPLCDFSLTSPPYMRSFDTQNPLSNYHADGNYEQYLKDMTAVYRQVQKIIKPGGRIMLEVSNTFGEGHPMTPLAWDIARVLSPFLFFERELIFLHESGSEAGPSQHSYCLVFQHQP